MHHPTFNGHWQRLTSSYLQCIFRNVNIMTASHSSPRHCSLFDAAARITVSGLLVPLTGGPMSMRPALVVSGSADPIQE
jgi:hypothetical protein